MDKSGLTEHISQQFNVELEDVRNKVLTMGGLVEQNLRDAVRAVVDGDSAICDAVIHVEERINKLEVDVDDEITRVLARRQPAAGDLRMLTTVLKTITDLERTGDEAEKIARMGIKMSSIENERIRVPFIELRHLGSEVRLMMSKSLDAFARMDIQTACEVIESDQEIDEEYESITRQLLTLMMEDPRNVRRAIDAMWIARALERCGDHAKNISEYVVYMVSGKDVRHSSLDDIAKAELERSTEAKA
jgi:phosphate transport system protein